MKKTVKGKNAKTTKKEPKVVEEVVVEKPVIVEETIVEEEKKEPEKVETVAPAEVNTEVNAEASKEEVEQKPKKKWVSKRKLIQNKVDDYLSRRNNKVIIGNWKTNKKFDDIKNFANKFNAYLNRDSKLMKKLNFIIGIAPTMIGMLPVASMMKKWVYPVAQFISEKEKGPYTGQVSYDQVHEYNVNYALVGHSETRQYLNVTDQKCRDTVVALVGQNMRPVLCIGETLEQYKAKESKKTLTLELMNCLKDLTPEQVRQVIIAYEPIWAIGTQTASLEYIEEMATFIRNCVKDLFDDQTAKDVHVLYGGTVTPDNSFDIMSIDGIDGVLVGGASLDPESFFKIVSSAPEWDYVKRILKPKLALDPEKAKKIREKKNKKLKIVE